MSKLDIQVKKIRVFRNRWFSRFARKERIVDADLCEAIRSLESGLVEANLGGGVIKQRIARANEGKSGGYRSIILFRSGDRAFFVYGFSKSQRDNIRKDELEGFRDLANKLLSFDEAMLAKSLQAGTIVEVVCDEKAVS